MGNPFRAARNALDYRENGAVHPRERDGANVDSQILTGGSDCTCHRRQQCVSAGGGIGDRDPTSGLSAMHRVSHAGVSGRKAELQLYEEGWVRYGCMKLSARRQQQEALKCGESGKVNSFSNIIAVPGQGTRTKKKQKNKRHRDLQSGALSTRVCSSLSAGRRKYIFWATASPMTSALQGHNLPIKKSQYQPQSMHTRTQTHTRTHIGEDGEYTYLWASFSECQRKAKRHALELFGRFLPM